jgi:hypothetical protein
MRCFCHVDDVVQALVGVTQIGANALREERDLKIAEQYRRAYRAQPQDEAIGRAGAALMARVLQAEEAADPHISKS